MYSLTICFGPTGTSFSLLFKDKKSAESARLKVIQIMTGPDAGTIEDEFGQQATFRSNQIHGILFEDLDLTDEAKILHSLANARNEIKARQRAATDPVIRTGAHQGGPSVLTPFRQN